MNKLFLITWKPEIGAYTKEQFNDLKKVLRKDGVVITPWSMRAASVESNDFVILFRQGEVTGLYGFGHIENPTEIPQKDGSKKIEIRLTNLRDSIDQPFFSKKDLIQGGVKESLLNTQSSAQGSFPDDQKEKLNQILVNKYGYGLEKTCFEYCIDKVLKK
jgi:hypothetical protein